MTFKEISEDRYNEMLEILPPAVWIAHGFMVGEAWRHDEQGRAMFAPFLHVDGRFYEGDAPMTVAEFRELDARRAIKGG